MDIIVAIIIISMCTGVIGYCLAVQKYSKKLIGTLRIDSSDSDGPYLFLELETDPNTIKKEKYITLKVDTKSYISQK